MARNKNKGFSIVEIVIAIAVLTLLLTPIVKQLAQTMRTNRIAKEQQYANENAQYVLEYIQNTPQEVMLDDTKDVHVQGDTIDRQDIDCEVYEITDVDGTATISRMSSPDTITYNAYKYDLNDVELGSRKTNYTRTAYLDDLSLQIMSTAFETSQGSDRSCRIAYDLSAIDGWELTDEGSLVRRNADGFVTAIVCKDVSTYDNYVNPNTVELGNIKDLDSSKLALITGTTTDFDSQAESDFYSLTLSYLKNSSNPTDKKIYEQELENGLDRNKSPLFTSDYLTNISKMTLVTIRKAPTGITDETKGGVYNVSVDVFYENTWLKGKTVNGEAIKYELKYNAYTQDFKYDSTEKCPDIYIEYQPYAIDYDVSDPNTTTVRYAADEYLLIDNTADEANVYLYKPKWDMAYKYMNSGITRYDESLSAFSQDVYYTTTLKSDTYTIEDVKDADGNVIDSKITYTKSDYTKVKIHVNDLNDSSNSDYKKTTIYTNLPVDPVNQTVEGETPQFICNESTSAGTSIYGSKFFVNNTVRNVFSFDDDNLKKVGSEDNKEDRLYTVSVVLEPDNTAMANEVSITGAKGGGF